MLRRRSRTAGADDCDPAASACERQRERSRAAIQIERNVVGPGFEGVDDKLDEKLGCSSIDLEKRGRRDAHGFLADSLCPRPLASEKLVFLYAPRRAVSLGEYADDARGFDGVIEHARHVGTREPARRGPERNFERFGAPARSNAHALKVEVARITEIGEGARDRLDCLGRSALE